MNSKQASDCCAEPAGKLLSVEDARKRMIEAVPLIEATQKLPLREALGRITAGILNSPLRVPPFDNSAMDGYAVSSADCKGSAETSLTVTGNSFAGAPFEGKCRPGECIRIMTGAVMPAGTDAVIMQEQVSRDQDRISFPAGTVKSGQNVRYAGEDLQVGDQVLAAGKQIGPAEIGLLASVGISELNVRRNLRVAFFSTGDELRSVGQNLQPGEIYDSNRYTLYGMLQQPGIELLDMGVVPDNREAVRDAFLQAAAQADAIITSGGVSVGEADYVKETLDQLGRVDFWRIAIKPGKPLAFGTVNNAVFFGLPGNPVSVMATFYQFTQPALRKMMGQTPAEPLVIRATCTTALKKSPGRMEFQRGWLQKDSEGNWTVNSTGQQGSHILSSMSNANCFILLTAECGNIDAGSSVDVQPFCGL